MRSIGGHPNWENHSFEPLERARKAIESTKQAAHKHTHLGEMSKQMGH